jgi:hypothetical protein
MLANFAQRARPVCTLVNLDRKLSPGGCTFFHLRQSRKRVLSRRTQKQRDDPAARVASPIGKGVAAPRLVVSGSVDDPFWIGAREHVPSLIHCFHPLGFVPEGYTGNAEEERLFLDPTGICEDESRLRF